MSNVAQNITSVIHFVKNIVWIGENAGWQHFLLFLQHLNLGLCGNESTVFRLYF